MSATSTQTYTLSLHDALPIFEGRIKDFLKHRKRVHPGDTQAVGGFNLGQHLDQMFSFMDGLQLLAIVVGALTLFSGVIAIASILLITVSERTKELDRKSTRLNSSHVAISYA